MAFRCLLYIAIIKSCVKMYSNSLPVISQVGKDGLNTKKKGELLNLIIRAVENK